MGGGTYYKKLGLNFGYNILRAFSEGVAYNLWNDQIGGKFYEEHITGSNEPLECTLESLSQSELSISTNAYLSGNTDTYIGLFLKIAFSGKCKSAHYNDSYIVTTITK